MRVDKPLPVSEMHDSPSPASFDSDEVQVFTADPATFLVASAVTSKVRNSISELKQIFGYAKPELEMVVDKVIASMVSVGLIKVFNDKIVLLKPGSSYIDATKAKNLDFLPKIFSLLSQRILKSATSRSLATGEQIQWFSLPNHPYIERRLVEIHRRYCQEMDQLTEWSEAHPECEGDKVRLTMVMSGNLNPEDF